MIAAIIIIALSNFITHAAFIPTYITLARYIFRCGSRTTILSPLSNAGSLFSCFAMTRNGSQSSNPNKGLNGDEDDREKISVRRLYDGSFPDLSLVSSFRLSRLRTSELYTQTFCTMEQLSKQPNFKWKNRRKVYVLSCDFDSYL